ncbi:shufflon system plasmid conjugative transfer pilus tip adhesin PilV [Salmonella enterica]|uniref:PilV2 n=11 Tax=Salmonella enterica TaxID=28901 RepID=Q6X909_SALET|nr:shufflon system plasmid conjugative transfer pilus tip adhesin PilV [Salmonella enterica]AAP83041.1 PilV2 [Salmonella enterica subsp. enterica serovar Paratyphi C]
MKKQKHDGGFVAMSVGAGLLIVLVMASLAARYMGDYLKSREWQVVAMQTNRFTQAVSSYVGKFYPTVLASATTTTPAVVTTQMLKNTGLLPASFSETNSYGQQYQAMIVRNQQNQELLQGMVVSRGGHAMPFTALSQISKDITAGFGGYVEDGQTAVGAMRSWRIPLSSYGTSTGRGHLAVMLSTDDLSGAREDGDRLYRFQVNGRPDLNKMHTAIDMGGNNLNSVGTVTASNVAGQNGNFGVSLVSNGPITAGGDIRSTGGWIVTRSGKGWMDETHGGGLYMSDNDWLRILNNKGFYTGGEIRGGKIRSDGDVSAGGILTLDKINVASTACPVNGAISRDTAGATLSCQIRYLGVGSKQIHYTALRHRAECECAVHRHSCLLQLDTSIFCSSRGAPEGLQCRERLVCHEYPLRRFSNRIDCFRNMPESAGCRALIHNPAPGKFKQVTEIVPPDS